MVNKPDFTEVYKLSVGDYLLSIKDNQVYVIDHINYIRNRPYYFTLNNLLSSKPSRIDKYDLLKETDKYDKLSSDDVRVKAIKVLYGKI